MTPEDALQLRGKILRRRAHMIAVACDSMLLGGWFGDRDEHVRLLMFFDYTFSKRLMTEERFTEEWPHHGMVPVPGWPDFVQAQN